MLGLKLNHVSKRGHWLLETFYCNYGWCIVTFVLFYIHNFSTFLLVKIIRKHFCENWNFANRNSRNHVPILLCDYLMILVYAIYHWYYVVWYIYIFLGMDLITDRVSYFTTNSYVARVGLLWGVFCYFKIRFICRLKLRCCMLQYHFTSNCSIMKPHFPKSEEHIEGNICIINLWKAYCCVLYCLLLSQWVPHQGRDDQEITVLKYMFVNKNFQA